MGFYDTIIARFLARQTVSPAMQAMLADIYGYEDDSGSPLLPAGQQQAEVDPHWGRPSPYPDPAPTPRRRRRKTGPGLPDWAKVIVGSAAGALGFFAPWYIPAYAGTVLALTPTTEAGEWIAGGMAAGNAVDLGMHIYEVGVDRFIEELGEQFTDLTNAGIGAAAGAGVAIATALVVGAPVTFGVVTGAALLGAGGGLGFREWWENPGNPAAGPFEPGFDITGDYYGYGW